MRQDTATPPPGRGQDTARTPVSVAEAADRLGVTHDAVRKKLQRGTLPGEKVAGEWRVFLPVQDIQQDIRQDATETRQDTARTDVLPPAGRDELIDQLRSENAFLRGQLEHRAQEAEQLRRDQAAERERFDVIHREALQRIEALTAGDDQTEKGEQAVEQERDELRAEVQLLREIERVHESHEDTEPFTPVRPTAAAGATPPPETTSDTVHEPSIVAGWLRRLLGRS